MDSDLLRKAQAGDARAFQTLIRPEIATVRRFARSFARNWSDADDIAQEALLKAFRSFHTYRAESVFSTWLYRVTKNTGIDWYRAKLSKAREREDEMTEVAPPESTRNQEQLVRERDRAALLWAALHELDATFRVPLVLYEIEGRSYEEIARVEGVPVGTIRSRLSRGRKHLGARLGESPEFARITPLPPEPGTKSAAASSYGENVK